MKAIILARVSTKEQRNEIAARFEQHQQGNEEYRTTLESLISSASRAAELFERSENRAQAPASRVRVFEPPAQRKKAGVFIASALRPDGQPVVALCSTAHLTG